MSFIPRVTGGAALRTRSDDSSDYIDVWWLVAASPLLILVGLAFIVGIVYFSRKFDICEDLCS
jgi:hypothetical protein